MTTVETKAPTRVKKLPLTALIAMVVGSMVGAGIFSPRNFALATGVYGALIAWAIAGTGMPTELVIFIIAVAGFVFRDRRPGDRRDHHLGRNRND